MGGLGTSIVVASVGQVGLAGYRHGSGALYLVFATIQCIESKQDLASLAPKNCFIPAKPVERIAGQIGEAQKATRGRWRDQRILAQSGAHFLFRL